MHTVTVPGDSFESLSAGFVRDTADFMIARLLRQDSPRLLHPGDGFGRVLAWTWRERGEGPARQLVADLLAALRTHHRQAHEIEPAVTLDELTADLRFALPGDMPEHERDELLAAVRRPH
ncbi:hypothetical protein [Saccharopolyspora sp. NPDC049357]|uniref:hypothetical protein n=1 Tax=Saccharopolyspora sp. NPDC049357 TaxID=3154507 RepID=UPI00342F1D42